MVKPSPNRLAFFDTSKEWRICEFLYQPEKNLYYETIFTLGNGYMAARGFLDEGFDGKSVFPSSCIKEGFNGPATIPGVYLTGIFDHYDGELVEQVSLPNFFNTKMFIGKEAFDLNKGRVSNYSRILDMEQGALIRSFGWKNKSGQITRFEIKRMISLANLHLAAVKYKITPLNYSGEITITSLLDGSVGNIDWGKEGLYELNEARNFHLDVVKKGVSGKDAIYLTVKTKTTKMEVAEAARIALYSEPHTMVSANLIITPNRIGKTVKFKAKQGNEYTFEKLITVFASRDRGVGDTKEYAIEELDRLKGKRFDDLFAEHTLAWQKKWDICDIIIKGNPCDQKAVRFNIFHLIQTNAENDSRVSIGGRFLGSEVLYGGVFWDTEMFVLPFFIYSNPKAARNLLLYRYHTLPQARAKAKRLWLKGAMYPWTSVYDGREQCDFWEYANVEVHIVADIAYAIWHYCQVTGDYDFMVNYGVEMLIETVRFWESRVWFDKKLRRYTLILVQGPDEYTGPVNNDTYTLIMAGWNLKMASKFVQFMKSNYPQKWNRLKKKLSFTDSELTKWQHINKNLYNDYYDAKKKLYIQDGNFLNRIPIDPKTVKQSGRRLRFTLPSYDTLLRYQIVKQPSIILLMYLLNEDFTDEEKKTAWNFYEPKTAHDSSLSYNTYAIMASELDLKKKAYEYFQKTACLDLDKGRDTDLGLHSACIGGTWQAVINGFAGMRLNKGILSFNPHLPDEWKGFKFKVQYRGRLINLCITKDKVSLKVENKPKEKTPIIVKGKKHLLAPGKEYSF